LHDDEAQCKRDDNPSFELIHGAVNLHVIGIQRWSPRRRPRRKSPGPESGYQTVEAE
jgi:hypothetical protein